MRRTRPSPKPIRRGHAVRPVVDLLLALALGLTIAACAASQPVPVDAPPAPAGEAAPLAVESPAGAGEAASGQPPAVWFDDLAGVEPLSDADALALARYVALSVFSGEAGLPPAVVSTDSAPRIVFVSISYGQAPAIVLRGAGQGVGVALAQVLEAATSLQAAGHDPVWMKVEFVREVITLEGVSTAEAQPVEYERSLYGLAFAQETGIAFLPDELVAQTLLDSDQEFRFDRMDAYLGLYGLSGEHLAQLAGADGVTVHRFTAHGFFSDGHELVPLYRGHRLFEAEQLTPDVLLAASVAAGDYLQQVVNDDGHFDYIYLPKSDRVPEDYNILRHAGTTYAMLELYELTGDAELLAAAQRALNYLLAQSEPCTMNGLEALCVVEGGEVKLGGAGLAAVALAKYIEQTGDDSYLPQLRLLGRWIQAAQADSGEFVVHKISYPEGTVDDFRSDYYPGEALLALARIYSLDPDEGWLDTAERGAQWLITVRDGGLATEQLTHDHWLLYALNDLYRYRPDPLYMDHALRIASAIQMSQLSSEAAYPDWAGGFYQPPRSTPVATRSEGLLAAYKLARDNAMTAEAEVILEAVKRAVAFQLQTQFRPEGVMHLSNPQRALGGFHRDLTNYEIRIDYVQHNLSSLIALYGALGGE